MSKSTTPSEQINNQILEYPDWRGETLARLRKLVLAADPEITEEWKWNTAGWSKNGMVCSAGAFKDHVKLNFFMGAFLDDHHNLFNAGLDSKSSRSIDFYEGTRINENSLKELIRAAISFNMNGKKTR